MNDQFGRPHDVRVEPHGGDPIISGLHIIRGRYDNSLSHKDY